MINIVPVLNGWYIMNDGEIAAEICAGLFHLKFARFRKGGRRLLHFHQLAFLMFTGDNSNVCLNDYSVEIRNGPEPEFILKARDAEKGAGIETVLRVIKDADGKIVYKITQIFKAERDFGTETVLNDNNSFVDGNGERQRYLQFSDPFLMHAVGPPTDYDGYWPGIHWPGLETESKDWRKHWRFFAYEREPGEFHTWRHHHENHCGFQKVCKGGIFAALNEPEGNPAFRFLSSDCYISICSWGYDIHLHMPGKPVIKAGQEVRAEYEIFALSNEQTAEIMKSEIPMPIPEGLAERPVVADGVNRFDRAYSIDDSLSFAWDNRGGEWDRTQGYDDSFSLKVVGKKEGDRSTWTTNMGHEMFMRPLSCGKDHRLSCWVKGNNVRGNGLRISLGYTEPYVAGYNEMSERNKLSGVCYSESLTGTFDWTRLEVISPAPKYAYNAVIALDLEGEGEGWFDNVLLEACE